MIADNLRMRETHIIGEGSRERIIGPSLCPSLAVHSILLAGTSVAEPKFEWVRLCPENAQILITTSGRGKVLVDGDWSLATPGTAYLTPAIEPHAYHALPRTPWNICWVMLRASAMERGKPRLVPTPGPAIPQILNLLCDEVLGPADSVMSQHLVEILALHLKRLFQPEKGDVRLRELWKIAAEDLAFPWSATNLADRLGMSSEHLRRLSIKVHGRPPMRHLTHLRLQRAIELLGSESCTIEAVAERVGYADGFALSHAFRRVYGVPPSEFCASRTIPRSYS